MQRERMCSKCKRKKATTFIKQIVNGYPLEMYLCDDCAKNFDIENEYNVFLSSIFGDLFQENYAYEEPKKKLTCKCGATEDDILNKGKFGCSECYKTFSDLVDKYISRLGGKTYSGKAPDHVGVKPLRALTIEGQIEELTNKMHEAANNQDYALAKEYQMKILELKNKMNK